MTPPYPIIHTSVRKCIILLLALCTGLVHAQRKPKIKGNRSVTQVQEALGEFHAVELLDDADLMQKIGKNARATIEKMFSPEVHAEQFIRFKKGIL